MNIHVTSPAPQGAGLADTLAELDRKFGKDASAIAPPVQLVAAQPQPSPATRALAMAHERLVAISLELEAQARELDEREARIEARERDLSTVEHLRPILACAVPVRRPARPWLARLFAPRRTNA